MPLAAHLARRLKPVVGRGRRLGRQTEHLPNPHFMPSASRQAGATTGCTSPRGQRRYDSADIFDLLGRLSTEADTRPTSASRHHDFYILCASCLARR